MLIEMLLFHSHVTNRVLDALNMVCELMPEFSGPCDSGQFRESMREGLDAGVRNWPDSPVLAFM